MSEIVTIIISSFISVILFVVGFILGEKQVKGLSHKFANNVLKALQIADKGEIQNTVYDKKFGGDFIVKRPSTVTEFKTMK